MKQGKKKRVYITKTERKKCQKVQRAFKELYEMEDILVLDAAKYGFIKLHYYEDYNFDINMIFTDSKKLSRDLWEEWRNLQLIAMAKEPLSAGMGYKQIFLLLPKRKQNKIIRKKRYFQRKAGIR